MSGSWKTRAALAVAVTLGLSAGFARAADPAPYTPAPTLTDEIKVTDVKLIAGYEKSHPRLLFTNDDIPALKKKAESQPDLWKEVLSSAKRLGNAAPDGPTISEGTKYWRIESVESAALAYLVTGDKTHADRAAKWMVAHCQQPIWGTKFNANHDLQASWYLYHISIGYDALHDVLSDADRKTIVEGLTSHAKAIYKNLAPDRKDPFTYDQNHLYIPTVALATASLALAGDVPEASDWLKRSYAIMQRCRYVMGNDGWYYEGTGYCFYALHWHERYADVMGRATGQNLNDLPALRETWRFPLAILLPATPGAFDIGDSDYWKDGKRSNFTTNNHAMLWGIASADKSSESQAVGDLLQKRSPEKDYPAAAFLWFDPSVKATPLEKIEPYHYFADEDYVTWRSGWGPDDTSYLFRCGPPEGHAAAVKADVMKDWRMNTGHVHADIGSFWMYAKNTYLASGTGYTAEKWTRDQNTILIDGIGQADDGAYHNARNYPYEKLDACKIDHVKLTADYAFASGTYGSAYPEAKVGNVSLRRTVVMTKGWMLVIDDMASEKEHKLTWICHSDDEFKKDGDAFISQHEKASLAIVPIDDKNMEDKPEPSMVMAGNAPGAGKLAQHGFQLTRTMTTAAKTQRLVHLLVPLGKDEKVPTVVVHETAAPGLSINIVGADKMIQTVTIDGDWLAPKSAEPVGEPVKISEARF